VALEVLGALLPTASTRWTWASRSKRLSVVEQCCKYTADQRGLSWRPRISHQRAEKTWASTCRARTDWVRCSSCYSTKHGTKLIQPSFHRRLSAESPLGAPQRQQPGGHDRFGAVLHGREMAQRFFSELNDPEDRAARFARAGEAERSGRRRGHVLPTPITSRAGVRSPALGRGIGIDRLVMLSPTAPAFATSSCSRTMRPSSSAPYNSNIAHNCGRGCPHHSLRRCASDHAHPNGTDMETATKRACIRLTALPRSRHPVQPGCIGAITA